MRPRCFALSIAIFAALAGCQRLRREVEPTPPERTDIRKITRQIPPHEAIPGTNARTGLLFTTTIPDLRATVEVREYYVSEGNELTLLPPSEVLFEIRSGTFAVDARDMKGEHSTGTIWTGAAKDRVVVRTTSELAILRATYVSRQ